MKYLQWDLLEKTVFITEPELYRNERRKDREHGYGGHGVRQYAKLFLRAGLTKRDFMDYDGCC